MHTTESNKPADVRLNHIRIITDQTYLLCCHANQSTLSDFIAVALTYFD